MKEKIVSLLITLLIIVPTAIILHFTEASTWVYFVSIIFAYVLADFIAKFFLKKGKEDHE